MSQNYFLPLVDNQGFLLFQMALTTHGTLNWISFCDAKFLYICFLIFCWLVSLLSSAGSGVFVPCKDCPHVHNAFSTVFDKSNFYLFKREPENWTVTVWYVNSSHTSSDWCIKEKTKMLMHPSSVVYPSQNNFLTNRWRWMMMRTSENSCFTTPSGRIL